MTAMARARASRTSSATTPSKSGWVDLGTARDRDVAEHERGIHGVVELRETAERARHHPPRVEQDLDALLALGLVLDCDRAAAPRGRGPRDRARIVVRRVLAQPLEDRARAGDARTTLAGVVRETAAHRDLVAADLIEIGVDVRRRRRRDAALPLHQVERPAHPQLHLAGNGRAPMMTAADVLPVGP